MRWSWRLGRVAGIDVKMHWTFLILLVWVAGVVLWGGEGVYAALRAIAIVLTFFACVVLHEFGHALTGKRFGIETRDITLLPIGGVARLARMPKNPWHEFLIAVAGPAVNVVIALLLAGYLLIAGGGVDVSDPPESFTEFPIVPLLLTFNVVVVLFNMLPAFPMDGGRVLRALLATRMSYVRATDIAANIGQLMAIAFAVFAIFYEPFLLLIALFVYLGAEAENRLVRMRDVIGDLPVKDAMITQFTTLSPDDTLADAVRLLLAGSQQDFPVVRDGKLAGMLFRQDLTEKLAAEGDQATVARAMRTEIGQTTESEPLERVLDRMPDVAGSTLPVLKQGAVVGLLTTENIGELIMVRSALRRDTPPATHLGDAIPDGRGG